MVAEIKSNLVPMAFESVGAKPQSNAAPSAVVQAIQDSANVSHLTPIPKAEIKVDPEQIRKNLEVAIEHLNKMMGDANRGLSFSMDHQLGLPIVVVKNSQTGEVVRQIPNEVVVQVAHSIEAFKGMLHNATV